MSDRDTDIVGHKTFSDGAGGFRHEPLTRAEADEIERAVDEARARRAERLPTEQSALNAMFDAFDRLRELGWREAPYYPKDGTPFDAIEAGSTGIHECHYMGEWPDGRCWVATEGDLYPSDPILWRAKK